MPIHKAYDPKKRKWGQQFGDRGKIYTGANAWLKARKQGAAIKSSQARRGRGRRMTDAEKARIALLSSNHLHGSPSEYKTIALKANTLLKRAKARPINKSMRFGGAAGSMKVFYRLRLPSLALRASKKAREKGIPRRARALINANIVKRPRVSGYMYEPPDKRKPAKIEVFCRNIREVKPVLTHELAHFYDYSRHGTAHTLESEKKAYSYQSKIGQDYSEKTRKKHQLREMSKQSRSIQEENDARVIKALEVLYREGILK
jgi:hypothetical protein